MKKRIACLAALAAAPFLLAMGTLGEPPVLNKAPQPKTKIDAVIVDMDGTRTEISSISYEGELYFPLYRGKAIVTVPFLKICRIEFGEKQGNRRQATVHFLDGRVETFLIDPRMLLVGELPIGTYQIQAKDIASLTFVGPSSKAGGSGTTSEEKQSTP